MAEIERLIKFFGTQEELARTLNVTQSLVSQWLTSGGVSPRRAVQIERITHGQFKAIDLVSSGANDETGN